MLPSVHSKLGRSHPQGIQEPIIVKVLSYIWAKDSALNTKRGCDMKGKKWERLPPPYLSLLSPIVLTILFMLYEVLNQKKHRSSGGKGTVVNITWRGGTCSLILEKSNIRTSFSWCPKIRHPLYIPVLSLTHAWTKTWYFTALCLFHHLCVIMPVPQKGMTSDKVCEGPLTWWLPYTCLCLYCWYYY